MSAQARDVVVIGGGLAGLGTAAFAARAGLRVELVERAASLGGRAATTWCDGFAFNRGPHALFHAGEAMSVLRDLGVPVPGGVPPSHGFALKDGKLHRLPTAFGSLLTSGLLSLRHKVVAAECLTKIPKLDDESVANDSVASWLARMGLPPEVRALIEAFVRLSTYGNAPESFSAKTALGQLKRAQAGVTYVDGGWQTLVDGLAERAAGYGATLTTGVRATSLDGDGPYLVTLDDGRTFATDAVVLATSPLMASTLLAPRAPSTRRGLASVVPICMASLTVALRRLPRREPRFVLGVDRPFYLSVHSGVAKVAPDGGALVHVGKYLPPGPRDADSDRVELESLLELAQPGFRDVLMHAEYLPQIRVVERLDLASERGAEGRPPLEVPELPGVYLAGDWVRGEEWLADASLASSRRVAERIVASARRVPARAVA